MDISMPTTEELSASVLSCTKKLIECAQASDLDGFNSALIEREEALKTIEATVSPSGDLERLSANLVETKRLNMLLQQDFAKQQQRLLDEKSALNRGSRMRQAYGDIKK